MHVGAYFNDDYIRPENAENTSSFVEQPQWCKAYLVAEGDLDNVIFLM